MFFSSERETCARDGVLNSNAAKWNHVSTPAQAVQFEPHIQTCSYSLCKSRPYVKAYVISGRKSAIIKERDY